MLELYKQNKYYNVAKEFWDQYRESWSLSVILDDEVTKKKFEELDVVELDGLIKLVSRICSYGSSF